MSVPSKMAAERNDVSTEPVPLLEQGDRLTRVEFERRYQAMPELKKAELIEGVVYMPSPVRFRHHSRPDAQLTSWLVHYDAATPGVAAAANCTVRLDQDNEPQPDALLRIETEHGGLTRISNDDYIEGPPELVAEIASSTVSFDLNAKRHVYRRSGVCEYLAWRVLDHAFDWFVLRDGDYQRLEPNVDGILTSEVFPGLWLDATAMLDGDVAAALRTLDRGLQSTEHAAFLQQLNPQS